MPSRRSTLRSHLPDRAVVLAVALVLAFQAAPSLAGKEPKKRVAVIDFDNKSTTQVPDEWGDVGEAMAEKLIEELIATEKFIVLERAALAAVLAEQNLGNVAHVEPQIVARLTGAQCLISGTITEIDSMTEQGGGLQIKGMRIGGGREELRVKVNIRIIDAVTAQVLQSKTVTGEARARGLSLGGFFKGAGGNVETRDKTPIGDAVDMAIEQAVAGIVEGMERVPWQGSISRVSGRQVIINAGAQENVEPGLELRVFERGTEIIDKDTNESLGYLDEEIGLVRVSQVQARFAIADVVDGRGFAPGNIVRPITTTAF